MKIFFVTPEAVPFSRAGGLGDVSYHLPHFLASMGHEVTVISPKYRSVDEFNLTWHTDWRTDIDLSLSRRTAEFYSIEVAPNHQAVLIGSPELFDRPGIYGNEFGDYDDNAERFIFFSRAALVAINKLARPDEQIIVHCHDWTTGLVPLYLKVWRHLFPGLKNARSIFTYHNLSNQGIFVHYDFAMTGLDWGLFTHEGLEFHGQLNLTKAGLIGADIISTVSARYAQESLSPEVALGLEGVLLKRQDDTYAVLNGVDYDLWSPETDEHIASRYDVINFSGKNLCRQYLSQLFGLADNGYPTVAVVSRLVSRKGLDLIAWALNEILSLPLNLVFMGLGEDRYQNFLMEAAQKYPGRVGVKISYDPILAHHITAGADMFLVPSRFEPCGLEQLYALKYGTVPVVRSTGGLDDTVIDVSLNPQEGTGYKFADYSHEALVEAIKKAVADFADQEKWVQTMRRGMVKNYSWKISALRYEKIYRQMLVHGQEKERA